jgi:hypothetical protein
LSSVKEIKDERRDYLANVAEDRAEKQRAADLNPRYFNE